MPYLQLFLYLNILLAGAIATIAIQHGIAHFRPHDSADKQDDGKTASTKPTATVAYDQSSGHLPPEMKAAIIEASQANFQAVLDQNVAELQHDLQTTVGQLNKKLDKLGSDIVDSEMKRYHKQLDELGDHATNAIDGAQSTIDKHQAELTAKLEAQHAALQAKLAADIAAEKQLLSQQVDSKLGDAVASFLIETLQHNVDLGAQNSYLTAMLEEHKDDFKQELSGEI
jgi:F0F1-type ATP synthase membrane subunit b/b'